MTASNANRALQSPHTSSHRHSGHYGHSTSPRQQPYGPPYAQPSQSSHYSHSRAHSNSHSTSPYSLGSASLQYPPEIPLESSSYPTQYPPVNERPFACDMCNLSFLRQHDLKRHKETHSGEKPHLCNGGCGKTFTRKDALKRHQVCICKRSELCPNVS
jgi:uncharacterized Zn-finger protein